MTKFNFKIAITAFGLLTIMVSPLWPWDQACAADEFYFNCPKYAADQMDRKTSVERRQLTLQPQTVSVFAGKDLLFANKIKSLLPNCSGPTVINNGISCLGCKNPYTEFMDRYRSGEVGDHDFLKLLLETNTSAAAAYLYKLTDEKKLVDEKDLNRTQPPTRPGFIPLKPVVR